MSVSLTISLMIDLQMLYLSHHHRQSSHAFLTSLLFASVECLLTLKVPATEFRAGEQQLSEKL